MATERPGQHTEPVHAATSRPGSAEHPRAERDLHLMAFGPSGLTPDIPTKYERGSTGGTPVSTLNSPAGPSPRQRTDPGPAEAGPPAVHDPGHLGEAAMLGGFRASRTARPPSPEHEARDGPKRGKLPTPPLHQTGWRTWRAGPSPCVPGLT